MNTEKKNLVGRMSKNWKKKGQETAGWSLLCFQINSNCFSGIQKIRTQRHKVLGSMKGETGEL